MELATKPSVKVNSRAQESPGPEARGSERVSPETGNETRTAGYDTPPPVLIPRRVRESPDS